MPKKIKSLVTLEPVEPLIHALRGERPGRLVGDRHEVLQLAQRVRRHVANVSIFPNHRMGNFGLTESTGDNSMVRRVPVG